MLGSGYIAKSLTIRRDRRPGRCAPAIAAQVQEVNPDVTSAAHRHSYKGVVLIWCGTNFVHHWYDTIIICRILLITQDSPDFAKRRPIDLHFSLSGLFRRCYLLL
ncbi:MAG: hypothetical protein OXC62_05630, partial [Aestuariivita sp.]|nr:hypothetical protein [Aestuariivita sp.]